MSAPPPSAVVVPYDERWPGWYAQVRERVVRALDAVASVEHVGSTVVPGLAVLLTSRSTLPFRTQGEIAAGVAAAGLVLEDVRQAPDRPDRELVFVTRRPA